MLYLLQENKFWQASKFLTTKIARKTVYEPELCKRTRRMSEDGDTFWMNVIFIVKLQEGVYYFIVYKHKNLYDNVDRSIVW